MAITGKFVANFTDFYDAVQKADVQLKGFQGDADKVATSLDKMSNSLKGNKMVQDAALMAEAVQRIGGVSKLTQNELQRLSAQAKEASEKLRRMGEGVPENLRKLAAEAKTASGSMGGLASGALKLASAVGIGFSAAAVVNFGKALLADAEALTKLSDKTGISVQWLQRLQVVGDDAGNTIEQMTSAISQMQNRIVEGSQETYAALNKLNLSWVELRSLSPDQQLVRISDALRGIEDPAEQVNIAMALFGRQGAEILPTLKKGFDDVKNSAVGMSDTTVRELEKIGDWWSRTWRDVKGVAAEIVASMPIVWETMFDEAGWKAKRAAESLDKYGVALRKAAAASASVGTAPLPQIDPKELQTRNAKADEEAAQKADAAAKKATAAFNAWREAAAKLKLVLGGLDHTLDTINGDVVQAVRYYLQAGVAQKTLATAYALTDEQVKAIAESLENEQRALDLVNEAGSITVETLKEFGVAAPEVEKVTIQIERLQRGGHFAAAAILAMGGAWSQARGEMQWIGQEWPELLDTLGSFQFAGIGRLVEGIDKATTAGGAMGRELLNDSKAVEGAISELSNAFAALSQIMGTTFGGATQKAGEFVSMLRIVNSTASAFGASISIGAGIATAGMFTLISALASAQQASDRYQTALNNLKFTAIGDIWRYMEKNRIKTDEFIKGLERAVDASKTLEEAQRKIQDVWDEISRREALADEASGAFGPSASELQERAKHAKELLDFMQQAGERRKDTGEFLPDFTQEQLDKAYFAWQKAMADAGDAAAQAWVDAHQDVTATAQAADAAMQALLDKRKELSDAIAQEAPEAVMGVIEQQQRAQLAAIEAQIAEQEQAAQAAADAQAAAAQQTILVWHEGGVKASDLVETEMVEAAQKTQDSWATSGQVAADSLEASMKNCWLRTKDGWLESTDQTTNYIETVLGGVSILIPVDFDVHFPDLSGYRPSITGGVNFGGAQAEGGSYFVTKPTMFLAGEAGPEYAHFSGANQPRYSNMQSWNGQQDHAKQPAIFNIYIGQKKIGQHALDDVQEGGTLYGQFSDSVVRVMHERGLA